MDNDGQANKGSDYTKCALYKHYNLAVDWTEVAEETTTQVTTGTTTPTTTQGGSTTLPDDDGDNLIPAGTKCQGQGPKIHTVWCRI